MRSFERSPGTRARRPRRTAQHGAQQRRADAPTLRGRIGAEHGEVGVRLARVAQPRRFARPGSTIGSRCSGAARRTSRAAAPASRAATPATRPAAPTGRRRRGVGRPHVLVGQEVPQPRREEAPPVLVAGAIVRARPAHDRVVVEGAGEQLREGAGCRPRSRGERLASVSGTAPDPTVAAVRSRRHAASGGEGPDDRRGGGGRDAPGERAGCDGHDRPGVLPRRRGGDGDGRRVPLRLHRRHDRRGPADGEPAARRQRGRRPRRSRRWPRPTAGDVEETLDRDRRQPVAGADARR